MLFQYLQDRLNKVHQNCLKETSKRRTLLEATQSNASNTYNVSTSPNEQLTKADAPSSLTKTLAFQ